MSPYDGAQSRAARVPRHSKAATPLDASRRTALEAAECRGMEVGAGPPIGLECPVSRGAWELGRRLAEDSRRRAGRLILRFDGHRLTLFGRAWVGLAGYFDWAFFRM